MFSSKSTRLSRSALPPLLLLLLPMLLLPIYLPTGVGSFRVHFETDADPDLAEIGELAKRQSAADRDLDALKSRLVALGKLHAAATDEDLARYFRQVLEALSRPRYGRSVDMRALRSRVR